MHRLPVKKVKKSVNKACTPNGNWGITQSKSRGLKTRATNESATLDFCWWSRKACSAHLSRKFQPPAEVLCSPRFQFAVSSGLRRTKLTTRKTPETGWSRQTGPTVVVEITSELPGLNQPVAHKLNPEESWLTLGPEEEDGTCNTLETQGKGFAFPKKKFSSKKG